MTRSPDNGDFFEGMASQAWRLAKPIGATATTHAAVARQNAPMNFQFKTLVPDGL
jgi:hypothetical protein